MKKAMMGASAAAAIALAPICIPPAHAGPYDACSGISDPNAREDCMERILLERPIAEKPPGHPAGSCRESATIPSRHLMRWGRWTVSTTPFRADRQSRATKRSRIKTR